MEGEDNTIVDEDVMDIVAVGTSHSGKGMLEIVGSNKNIYMM